MYVAQYSFSWTVSSGWRTESSSSARPWQL